MLALYPPHPSPCPPAVSRSRRTTHARRPADRSSALPHWETSRYAACGGSLGTPRHCGRGPAAGPPSHSGLAPRPPPGSFVSPLPVAAISMGPSGSMRNLRRAGYPEWLGGRARRCKESICPKLPAAGYAAGFLLFFPKKERKRGGGERKSEPTRQPRSLVKVPLCWKKGQMCLLFAH